jgi:hypothetical protein
LSDTLWAVAGEGAAPNARSIEGRVDPFLRLPRPHRARLRDDLAFFPGAEELAAIDEEIVRGARSPRRKGPVLRDQYISSGGQLMSFSGHDRFVAD